MERKLREQEEIARKCIELADSFISLALRLMGTATPSISLCLHSAYCPGFEIIRLSRDLETNNYMEVIDIMRKEIRY